MYFSLDRLVQMGKINTNPHPAVCLRHNNHSGAPICWLCHFGDDPLLFHSSELFFDSRKQWMWYFAWSIQAYRPRVVSKIDMVLHLQLSKAVKQLWKVLVYSYLIHHQFD